MHTKKHKQQEMEFDIPTASPESQSQGLVFITKRTEPLRAVQAEFNKLMKSLENVRRKQEKEGLRLDKILADITREVYPLKKQSNRLNFELVTIFFDLLTSQQWTLRRQRLLKEILFKK